MEDYMCNGLYRIKVFYFGHKNVVLHKHRDCGKKAFVPAPIQWAVCKRSHPQRDSKAAFGKLMFFKMAAMRHMQYFEVRGLKKCLGSGDFLTHFAPF